MDLAVPRPIDLYTKVGGVSGYSSCAALVPEHNIALTIHVAGNDSTAATQTLLSMIAKSLITYVYDQARKQAFTKYAGTYRSMDGNSSIFISADDCTGLRIETAVLHDVVIIPALVAAQGLDPLNASARLYSSTSDTLSRDKDEWSILLDRFNEGMAKGFAEQYCASRNWADKLRYAGQSLDRVTFYVSENKATGIEMVDRIIMLLEA